ncbi:MAG: hypothetical protein SGILL_009835, partial [Bacillariaceae sp.]
DFESGKKRVQPKVEALYRKTRFSQNDLTLQNGSVEMDQDLEKESSQRSGYLSRDFYEVYEHVLEPGQKYMSTPLPPVPYSEVPKKTKKGVKRKLVKDDEAVQSEKDQAAGKAAKKKKKKVAKSAKPADKEASTQESSVPLKKRKKKLKQVKEASDLQAHDENKQAVAQPQTKLKPSSLEEDRMSAYDEYMLAMGEERSHGDTDDEDLDVAGLGSDDEEDYAMDNNYVSDSRSDQKKPRPVRSKDPKPKAAKEEPKRRGTKAKIEKRRKGEKKAPAEGARRRAEQRRFEVCEQNFSPLIRRWKRAISNKDADQMARIYREVLGVVEKFSASFIQVHELSVRMKESKKILSNDERKELLGKLKTQYSAKVKDVPAGFVPKRDSDEPASASVKSEQKSPSRALTLQKLKSKTVANEEKDTVPRKKLTDVDDSDEKESNAAMANASAKDVDTKKERPSSQQVDLKQLAAPVLDKRKKFSLGKLMRPPSVTLLDDSSEAKQGVSAHPRASPATIPPPSPRSKKTAIWLSQVSEVALQATDQNRVLALEFLRQAVPFVPLRKGVNLEAIARNLEVAIFDWASSEDMRNSSTANGSGNGESDGTGLDDALADTYWNKLHGLVAGISGKHKAGTIATMIGQGKFETPNDLVKLSDDTLFLSFQGKPLSGL